MTRSQSSAPVRPASRPPACSSAHGVAPVVIDEGAPAGRTDLSAAAAGTAARHRRRCSAPRRKTTGARTRRSTRLRDRIDYRPQTLAWAIEDRTLHTIQRRRRRDDRLRRAHPGDRRDRPHAAGRGLDAARRVHARRRAGAAQGARLPDRPARRVLRQLAAALSRGQAVSRRWAPRSSRCSTRRRSPPRSRQPPICWRRPARSRAVSDTWRRCAAPASPCITASRCAPSRARPASRRCAFAIAHGKEITLRLRCGRGRVRPQARDAARRARRRAARLRSGLPPMAAARRRGRPLRRQRLSRRRRRDGRRRAGRGAHRRACGLRGARGSQDRGRRHRPGALAAAGRAAAPLPARPRARLRVAGRRDPRARRRRHGLPLRGHLGRRAARVDPRATSARPRSIA